MRSKTGILLVLIILLPAAFPEDYTCGDNICQPNENYKSCPKDCRQSIRDNYCNSVQDNRCDLDCYGTDPDCFGAEQDAPVKEAPFWKILAAGGASLVILAGIFILMRRATKKQDYYDVKQINQFSNIQEKKEDTWANMSEKDIVNTIKKSEDFKQYEKQ